MENTLYIVWNKYNQTGIPILDEQHRGIVSSINSLHYFIQKGQVETIILPTLVMLGQYTNIHFATEETLMTEAGYPELENHLRFHQELKKNTDTFYRDVDMNKPDVIVKFLKEWWLGHINKEDKKYAPFLL